MDARNVIPANVRPEHDLVWRLAAEFCLVKVAAQKLDVTTATEAEFLRLVLHGELQDKVLAFVRKGLGKFRRNAVIVHILGCQDALLLGLICRPLSSTPLKLARRAIRTLPRRLHPTLLPVSR